jgi:hypothetical protein
MRIISVVGGLLKHVVNSWYHKEYVNAVSSFLLSFSQLAITDMGTEFNIYFLTLAS